MSEVAEIAETGARSASSKPILGGNDGPATSAERGAGRSIPSLFCFVSRAMPCAACAQSCSVSEPAVIHLGGSRRQIHMTRDVYAGDEDMGSAPPSPCAPSILFIVTADPDFDCLARISAIIAMTNSPPHSGSLITHSSGQLIVTLEIRQCSSTTAEFLRRKLEQLTCVITAELVSVGT